MRVELIPLILGVLVALLGVGIIFDAWTPDELMVARERRRRPRVERHRGGEALIGFGVLALAAAFIGRDTWRFSTLVVIIGAAFLVLGTVLNFAYVRELVTNRGPLRRRDPAEGVAGVDSAPGARRVVRSPAHDADRPVDRAIDSRAADSRPAQPDTEQPEGGYTGVERRAHPRGNRGPRP
jgi:hypothetical protein